MKILVTGGAGYIGSVLTPMLLDKGHEVIVLDSLMYGITGLLPCSPRKNFKFVKGDVRNEPLVQSLVKDADAVIHLAAIVGFPACARDEKLAYDVNLTGSQIVGRNLSRDQIMFYASTGSNYGVVVNQLCTEETPLNPLTVYGKSKTMAEQFLRENCTTVAYRYATAFGVSPRLRLDLMINDFVFQALKNKNLTVFEKDFKRTFIHVHDIARSFVFALENLDKMKNNVYNVGSETMNFTKEEIVRKIQEKTGCGVHFAEVGTDADQRNYEVSYKKINSLGFSATRTIDQGIDELVDVLRHIKTADSYKNVFKVMKVSVCLPTYNEAKTITGVINGVLENFEKTNVDFEIVVVDDNSPDGTAEIVKNMFINNPKVRCIVRTNERGFATAVKTFIENSTGDHILLMDADGNHDPNCIPTFLSLASQYDAVCGSRFSWGGGMEGSKFRYRGSYWFNLAVRMLLGLKSRDNTSGYLLFRREMLKGLDLNKVFRGYGEYFFTLLYHFKNENYSFIDIPVKYLLRAGGSSKTTYVNNLLRYFWLIGKLRTGAFKYKK